MAAAGKLGCAKSKKLSAMRILITGGLGFIGRACIARLLDRGCREIRVLDNLDASVHGTEPDLTAYTADWDERVRVTIGSVADQALLARQLHDVDTVLHLASLTSVPGSMQNTAQYCEVNVVGTANLVGLLANATSVRRLILVSSRAVYGEGPYRCRNGCGAIADTAVWRTPSALAAARWDSVCPTCGGPLEALAAGEDAALNPTSVYGLTKLAQEHLVRTAMASDRMEVAIYRLQNVYGVGQSRATPDVGVANILAEHALGGATLQLFEDGLVTRDFVYIDDVADLLVHGGDGRFSARRSRYLQRGHRRCHLASRIGRSHFRGRESAPKNCRIR